MWFNPNLKDGQIYAGSYDLNKKGKRIFELLEFKIGKSKKRYKYSSPQKAKELGWKRL